IVNLLRLANVGAMTSFNYPLDITITIALFAIAVIVPCFVFLPNYNFKEKELVIFSNLSFTHYDYADILFVRQDSEKKYLLIYTRNVAKPKKATEQTSTLCCAQICVSQHYYDQIVDFLKQKNNKTIYELIEAPLKPNKTEKK
ncbi:MAG: hypothetical protein RSB61_06330, partial [Clostridia bacterium]